MRLKRLTISGFKSFPKRTSITFSEGISAIVGPNGSGKSNIVDAIRWVLGEQNPRLLRARNMDDLIYRGNGKKAPRSAYVRLILENSAGMAPPELESIPEIEIERILFPSGEAKFRLNRKNCRLKDIRYLFLDTGAGARAYSIIDQGQVGHFVSMSSDERRMILEEVAGISRYKARRAEAAGRLKQTLHNLERLGDIVMEVEKQARSLKRQASRATRYLGLREKEEILSLFLLKNRWSSVCSRESELLGDRSVQAGKKEDLEARLSVADAKIGETDLLMEENRQQLKTVKDEIGRMEADIEELSLFLVDREKDLALCRQTRKGLEEKFKDASSRRAGFRKRLESICDRLEGLKDDSISKEKERRDLRARVEEQEEKEALWRKRLEDARRILVDLAAEKAGLKSRKTSFKDRLKGLDNKLSRLERQAQDALEDKRGLEEGLSKTRQRAGEAEARISQGRKSLSSLKKRLLEVEDRISRLRDRILEGSSRQTGLKAELDTLSRIISSRVDVPDGVRHLFKELGIHARLLSATLKVEKGWEDVIEVALGETLGAFLLKEASPEDILKITGSIRDDPEGYGGLSVLPAISSGPAEKEDGPSPFQGRELPEGVSVLSRRVGGESAASVACRNILSSWLVSENMETALGFRESCDESGPFFIITLDGFVITPWNEIRFTGSPRRQKGLLWTRARRDEVLKELNALDTKLSKLEEKARDLKVQRKVLAEEISGAENKLLQEQEKMEAITSEERRISEALGRIMDRLEMHDFEREEVLEERQVLEGRLSDTEKRLSSLVQEEEELEEKLQELDKKFREASGEKKELHRRLHVLSVEKARIDTEIKGIEAEVSRLQGEIESSRNLSEDMKKEISILSQEERDIIRQIKEITGKKQAMVDAEALVLKKLKEKEDVLEELISRRAEAEGVKRKLMSELSAVSERLHQTDLELSRLSKEKEYLEDTCRSKLQRRISEDYDFPADIRGIDPEEAREKLKEVREKIEKIGAVNLAAIEEFAGLEKRLVFLKEQEADLRASMKDIQKAIDRIDRQCRKKFKQALEDVNASLGRVFPLLFDGGQASLRLDNPGNILESGVEFMIEIPGKRIRNLNLLSGGEKALGALALIFSIFFIKPSPFCLLDEVDAPLDEANTVRFNKLVRKISRQSQVILVTHNQQVMETADTLYGVTMEERGISKLISVSLV